MLIWRQLCDEKLLYREGLGIAYYNAGRIFIELDLHEKALDFLSLSWDMLIALLNLDEWRANIRIERAIAYWRLNQATKSATDVEWVMENGTKLTVYKANFLLGGIEWEKGNNSEAYEHLISSLDLAREIKDVRTELKSLCYLTNIVFFYEWGAINSIDDFENYLNQTNHSAFSEFPWFEGIMLTNLGHLAIKYGEFNKGLNYYKQGLSKIAIHQTESMWPSAFTLSRQLSFMDNKVIRLLSSDKVCALGAELDQCWSESGLVSDHPEALLFLVRWKHYKDAMVLQTNTNR